jgi:mono/diheme cytochrome c family protein
MPMPTPRLSTPQPSPPKPPFAALSAGGTTRLRSRRPRHRTALIALVAAAAGVLSGAAVAQEDPRIHRGRQFAETNCAMCHAVGRFGDSPLAIAPPFRTLSLRYPVEDLEEALAEGVVTGHPTMPQFQLDSAQIADFIAYLKTLEK